MVRKKRNPSSPAQHPRRTLEDAVAALGDDLHAAEKQASQTINLRPVQVPMGLAMIAFFLSLFLPHSGSVLGLDVLFNSATAQQFLTTVPERIYTWLGVIGVLVLGAAALFSRYTLVALFSWFFSGCAAFYSIFAIWMRQSRPPTEPGEGPAYGLLLGAVAVWVFALALSRVILKRSALQRAVAHARAQRQEEDEVAKEQLRILRAESLESAAEEDGQPAGEDQAGTGPRDTRRQRSAQRRRAREQAQGTQDDAAPGASSAGH